MRRFLGLVALLTYFACLLAADTLPFREPKSPNENLDLGALELATLDNFPELGNSDAELELKVFSDFLCGMCSFFIRDSLDPMLEKYVTTGKLKLSLIDFPLSYGKEAVKTAQAAHCARLFSPKSKSADQTYYDFVYHWFGIRSGNFDTRLASTSKELGLDANKIKACVSAKLAEPLVKKGYQEGKKLGIDGTPTLILGDELIPGAIQPWDLEKLIAGKLERNKS